MFDLEHIFIVFSPGGGGNFIARVLNKILDSTLSDIAISSTGSSHNNLETKISGKDYMSFGTRMEEHSEFESEEDRESFYLEKIKTNCLDITVPQVVWTHDYTNILLYRKYFKNSKILVITHNSDIERLVTLFMNITKTLLDKQAVIPLTQSHWEDVLSIVDQVQKYTLVMLLKDPAKVKSVLENKDDPCNQSLISYSIFVPLLNYYGMTSLVEQTASKTPMVFDNVLYPLKDLRNPYKVGLPIKNYIDSGCVQIPYEYLINNQVDILIKVLEEVLSSSLTEKQVAFVKNSFTKYRDAQDQILLTDPVKYYNDLKESALNSI